jgi:uncharacterized protein YdhG (YjbR/CyaY superfamily)
MGPPPGARRLRVRGLWFILLGLSMKKGLTGSCGNMEEYIAGCPDDVQQILQRIRREIRDAAPGAVETIKYGIPTFVLGENLVHFAACKKHVGFYPTPSGITHFQCELCSYPSAKGSVQFPFDRAIPYDLIKRITKFRVQEVLEKKAAKKKRR